MSRKIVVSVSALLLIAAVAGYWIVKDETGAEAAVTQTQQASNMPSGAAGSSSQNSAATSTGPAAQAAGSAASAPNTGALGSLPLSQDVQQLVSYISFEDRSQTRVVMQALAKLGDQYTDEMISALIQLTDRLTAIETELQRGTLSQQEREALTAEHKAAGWQRLQLVTLLGHRWSPSVVEALIYVGKAIQPHSLEHKSVLMSLTSQGPSQQSRDYVLALLNSQDSGLYQKQGAIGYLAENADPTDSPLVDQLLNNIADPQLKGAVLYWAAKLKDHTEMRALIESHLTRVGADRNAQYQALFALAEVASPEELEAVTTGKTVNAWDKASALRIAQFNQASAEEKEPFIRHLLASTYTEEKLAAIKYMLENDKTDWLQKYGVSHLHRNFASPSGGNVHLELKDKRLMRLAGYDVQVVSGRIVIHSLRAP